MRLAAGLSPPVSAVLVSDSGVQLGSASRGCCVCEEQAGLTAVLVLQDRVVRAAGTGVAVQEPACRGSHLADRQRRGSQTGPGHCQPGQRGQCKYLSCRSASDSSQGERGCFKRFIVLITGKRTDENGRPG